MKKTLQKRTSERRKGQFEETCWIIAVFGGLAAIPIWMAASDVRNSNLATRQVEARIAHLRAASASDLAGNSPNTEVVIQGRISQRAPTKHGSFAAYVETYDDNGGEGPRSTVTKVDIRPPLPLQTAKGNITIVGYSLDYPTDEKAGEPAYHYSGIKPGQLVSVGGYIERDVNGPVFQYAAVLDPESTSYASYLREQIESPVLSVIECGFAALFFLGFGGVILWLGNN